MHRIMVSDLKILHIEDDNLMRQSVAGVLGVYNLLISVSSVAEAKTILQESPFDLVLLDKNLPDGLAVEVIPLIFVNSPDAAIILVTGDNDYLSVTNSLKLGAHDYIFKSTRLIQDLLMRIPVVLARLKSSSGAVRATSGQFSLPKSLTDVSPEDFRAFKNSAEREYLCRVLELAEGNVATTAESTGLARSTFFKKLAELGVTRIKKYSPESLTRENS